MFISFETWKTLTGAQLKSFKGISYKLFLCLLNFLGINKYLWAVSHSRKEKSKQGQGWSLLKVSVFLLNTVTWLQAFLQSSFCYKWVEYCCENNSQQKFTRNLSLQLKEVPVTIPFWKHLSSEQMFRFSLVILLINSKEQAKKWGGYSSDVFGKEENKTVHPMQRVNEDHFWRWKPRKRDAFPYKENTLLLA